MYKGPDKSRCLCPEKGNMYWSNKPFFWVCVPSTVQERLPLPDQVQIILQVYTVSLVVNLSGIWIGRDDGSLLEVDTMVYTAAVQPQLTYPDATHKYTGGSPWTWSQCNGWHTKCRPGYICKAWCHTWSLQSQVTLHRAKIFQLVHPCCGLQIIYI